MTHYSEQLKRELDIEITDDVFWTDSRVVLDYIANSVRRFHVFVANRVQEIQDKSAEGSGSTWIRSPILQTKRLGE